MKRLTAIGTVDTDYWFIFDEPPKPGIIIRYGKVLLRLDAVEPYVRRDGSATHVLRWTSSDGRTGTSGMAGKAITWHRTKIEGAGQ